MLGLSFITVPNSQVQLHDFKYVLLGSPVRPLFAERGESLNFRGDMSHQSWEFGKAIRPLFAELVT